MLYRGNGALSYLARGGDRDRLVRGMRATAGASTGRVGLSVVRLWAYAGA